MSVISALPVDESIKTQKPQGNEKAALPEKDKIAAKKVAREFETLFVGMMLKSMRETVGKDSLTNGGHGEDVYRSLLDQEYARAISENHGLGLADIMEKELLKSVPKRAESSVSNDVPG
ncbi:MAG TPA: rod-binding protein [Geobacteraceae bacterium]|nr:rod-binding protein [Geobacteraceae bacterium]